MAIQTWRRTVFLFTTATATCAIVASIAAQPPRPSADDPAERRPVPPQADREPGYLGLVTDDRRDQGQGVRVLKVVEDSPAAKAGFAVDDLIVAIGGQPTSSLNEMGAQLQPRGAGEKVRFEIRRGGATQTLEVELGRRPALDQRPFEFGRIPERLPEPQGTVPPVGDAAGPFSVGRPLTPGAAPQAPRGQLLGIRTAPVTEDVRQRLGIPNAAGARVISRVVGSPADKAGIPLDAVIVAVDEQTVASPADLARHILAAGAGRAVELTFLSGGQQRTARVTLAGDAGEVDATPPGESRTLPQRFDRFAPAPSAAERIDMLERRIRELELRVQELERARGAPNPAAQGKD